jgi:hypothetical protein
MNLPSLLKGLKPSLSMNSCHTYGSLLKHLWSDMGLIEDYSRDVIDAYASDIIKHIEKTCEDKPKKAKQLYSALLVFESPDLFSPLVCFERFRNLIHQHNQNDMSQEEKQVLTKKQEEAYMKWSDIIKHRQNLRETLWHLWTKPEKTTDELYRCQDYVIACLYTMTAPRRLLDYVNMSKYPPIGLRDNGIIRRDNKMYFVFGHYKTAATYGQQIIEIPGELATVLEEWIPMCPTPSLLFYRDLSQSMNVRMLQKKLARIFEKPGFGVNILRHAFITDNVLHDTPFVAELKETATQMGHSVSQALLYKKHI